MTTSATTHTAKMLTLAAALLLCGLLLAYAASPAEAADLTVRNAGDSGNGTLRAALATANANGEADTITFDLPAGERRITLESELTAAAADETTVDGSGNVTVSGGDQVRVFFVDEGAKLAIKGLTVTHGRPTRKEVCELQFCENPRLGGGIVNRGTMTITDSKVTGNSEINSDDPWDNADVRGGGIYNRGTMTVTGSIVSDNFNGGSGDPGELLGSVYGGGIYNEGTMTVTGSAVSDNITSDHTVGEGGGIHNQGDLTVTDSTVSGNGGGDGRATYGGGIFHSFSALSRDPRQLPPNDPRRNPRLDITNSTVSGNKAINQGGGLWTATMNARVRNSTISGNEVAEGSGGGIYSGRGKLDISSSTITENKAPPNHGAGVYWRDSECDASPEGFRTQVVSSVIAGNDGTDVDREFCFGEDYSFVSLGYNVVGGGDAAGNFGDTENDGQTAGNAHATDVKLDPDGDPGLGPLADNGGPTRTHALETGSPAVDLMARDVESIFCPATDQRGEVRPQDGDRNGSEACDAGSFEVLGPEYFAISDAPTVAEGDSGTKAAVFTVTRRLGTTGKTATSTVDFATVDGTATAGQDFVGRTGTLTFRPGETEKTIRVTVNGDTEDEKFEDFKVTLSNPSGTVAVRNGEGMVTIADDDNVVLAVDTTDDDPALTACTEAADDDCSLRGAIIQSNTEPGHDSISVPAGTYRLTVSGVGENESATGDLDVTDDVTIEGAGSGTTTVSGGGEGGEVGLGDRVLHVPGDDVAAVPGDTDVAVSGLTISGGRAVPEGWFNFQLRGGGVRNESAGELTLDRVVVSDNTARDEGGGIFNRFGDLKITGSTVSANTAWEAGGIYSYAGTVTVTRSTVSANSASMRGGGIYSVEGALTVTGSTVNDNTVREQGGAGILFADYMYPSYPSGPATIENSTISGNSTNGFGGGVYNLEGLITLRATTITDNTAPEGRGAGVFSVGDDSSARTVVGSSIIAGNNGPDADSNTGYSDPDNTFESEGHNVVGDGDATRGAFNRPGDRKVSDPGLEPLADNGGPTRTHALKAGSPALDGGDTDLATDQRGRQRPRDGDGDGTAQDDSGSFEVQEAYGPQPQCSDGDDNDGDGRTDFGGFTDSDPGCESAEDDDETGGPATASIVVEKQADSADAVSCFTLVDDDDCSLREAIIKANATPGADTVVVPAGTYALSVEGRDEDASRTGDLDVTDELTLTGAGARKTIIDARGIDRVLHNVNMYTKLNITGVTITGGHLTDNGGNLLTAGGGIENIGDLELRESAVRNNTTSNALGGAINSGSGGGDGFSAANLTIIDSTVSGNSTDQMFGGTIHIKGQDTTTRIENSTISGNSTNGRGGGILLLNGSALEILNSTITNNTATHDGSGLSVFGDSTAAVKNSIVAGNGGAGNDCDNDYFGSTGTITSSGNINSDGSCPFIGPGDQPNTNPQLGALADNGGPTDTHALQTGSPAVDAGDNAACPGEDQRGTERPQDGDDDGTERCDTGSFELEDATPPLPQCSDNVDNDADGRTDFGTGGDPGCESADDDDETGTPVVSVGDAGASEGAGSISFAVTRSGDTGSASSVDFATADGTATTADGDYEARGGTLTFAPGEMEKTVTVTIGDDAAYEPDETFTVGLSGPSGATLGDDSGTGTIADDDTPPNAAPVAGNTTATTNEDTPKGITLEASDADGDALTYRVVDGPRHGTLSGTAPNLTYTPRKDYSGPDSFTFNATDGEAESNRATVSITVSPVNDAPVAKDDSAATDEDTPTGAIEVLENDTDADNDVLSVAGFTQPAHGAVSRSADGGALIYTPRKGYSGPDSFAYRATDGEAESDPATVSVDVRPVNAAPRVAISGGVCLSDAAASGRLDLTLDDPDDPEANLTMTATSSNKTLIPNSGLVAGGSGAERTLRLNAMLKKSGTSAITVSVSDGTNRTELPVTLKVGSQVGETITGSDDANVIFGLGGDDKLTGGGSRDLVCGGIGNDTIRGVNGSDSLDGGQGDDRIHGENGGDRLLGKAGNDTLTGGTGADRFEGGSGVDRATDFNSREGDTKTSISWQG